MTDTQPHGTDRLGRRAAAAALCSLALLGGVLADQGSAAAAPKPVPVKVPAMMTLTGAGWGHGVGLSQYGALGMAEHGSTAEQIVEHYYTGTTVAPVRDDMDLRVNLLHRTRSVTMQASALAGGGGRLQLKLKGSPAVQVAAGDRVRLVRRGDVAKAVVRPRVGGRVVVGRASKATVRWAGTRKPGRTGSVPTLLDVATTWKGLGTAGHRYRYGAVRVATSPDMSGALEVVNMVQLHQEYLLGIAEVPSSWPTEALQAQVLAARSYALSKYGTGKVRASCRCQLDDGGGPYYDQTFVGYAKESSTAGSAWRGAVRATTVSATTGNAVLYQGKAITAFYSSSTGGRTQASKDVWGGDLPYAQSVSDPWSLDPAINPSYAAWSRVGTQAKLAALFGLPDVVSLDLSDVTAGDALAEVTATSSTGVKRTIRGSTFASGLGLPSRWVSKATPSYTTGK